MYISPANVSASTALFPGPSALTEFASFSVTDLISVFRDGNGDSPLQRWSSLIGIVTAITGNILISFALNIQRYAHIRLHRERVRSRRNRHFSQSKKNGYGTTNGAATDGDGDDDEVDDPLSHSLRSVDSQLTTTSSDDEHEERKSYLKSPYWWAGILLMTVGEAGNFLAYGFAPASIVSPLGVVALISNCVIAPIMLKERFRVRDFWGVVVAIGGAVTVVLSAKQQEKKLGPHEVWGAITRTEFEAYMAVTIALIAVLMWASPKYGSRTVLVDLGLVGLFGGYTALSTKGVSSMLSSTLWRALTTPVTYALVIVLVGTALMQVKYLNRALQRFDSTQVIPVQFVIFTLSVIIGSAILYRDFESTTPQRAAKFVGGCLLTFFGVFLITSGRESHEDDDDYRDDEDVEGTIALLDNEAEEQQSAQASTTSSVGIQRAAKLSQHDGTDDEPSSRQSRVSFASSPSRPQSPRRFLSENGKEIAFVLTPSGEDSPSNTLLRNPWSDIEPTRPSLQNVAGSSSAPVLPSEAQYPTVEPAEEPLARSSSHTPLQTHPIHQSPVGPPQADTRPSTPLRPGSLSLMMPSPLISTISSPMSMAVNDGSRTKTLRKQRSMRRSRSGSQRLIEQPELEESLVGTPSAEEPPSFSNTSLSRSRARSLSNTLGDWFGNVTNKPRMGSVSTEAGRQTSSRQGGLDG